MFLQFKLRRDALGYTCVFLIEVIANAFFFTHPMLRVGRQSVLSK